MTEFTEKPPAQPGPDPPAPAPVATQHLPPVDWLMMGFLATFILLAVVIVAFILIAYLN